MMVTEDWIAEKNYGAAKSGVDSSRIRHRRYKM